jgi:hypothetical protein
MRITHALVPHPTLRVVGRFAAKQIHRRLGRCLRSGSVLRPHSRGREMRTWLEVDFPSRGSAASGKMRTTEKGPP